VGIIDRSKGLENPLGITNLTPEIDYNPKRNARGPGDRQFPWAYRDPYPISEQLFVVSYGGGGPNRYRLFLMNDKGDKELLYEDKAISCFNPVPLIRRTPPHNVYAGPPSDEQYGAFFVADVYRGLVGVERGQVAAIRVMKVIPKPCNMRGQRAYDMDPLMSRGTYYGTYDHTRPGRPGSRDAVAGTKWFERFDQVYRRRCASCHGKDFYTQNNGRHHTWINLTHPNWSRVLTAPLAKTAGGLQLCKPKDNKEPQLFPDKTDPDFKTILAAIDQGKKDLYANPRTDMPNAKPLPYPKNYAGPFKGFAGP